MVGVDILKARFPISVFVGGMAKRETVDDLNDLMLWCGGSRKHRSRNFGSRDDLDFVGEK